MLSESYLYTKQMIAKSLKHLTDEGIMVVQFGELDFDNEPNRTARYVMTARAGLEVHRHQGPGPTHDRVGVHHPQDRRPGDDHPEAHAVHAGGGRPVHEGRALDCRW